jgi:threonine dehydrogenase-like Zn-dependent dehydrogenase
MKFTYPRAIQLVEKQVVDFHSLITHHFPLEKIGEAFTSAQSREGIKVIVQVSSDT